MRAVLQHQHLHTHLSLQSTPITMLAPAHSWASSSSMGDSPRERVNGRDLPISSCLWLSAGLGVTGVEITSIAHHHITSHHITPAHFLNHHNIL